MHSLNFRKCNCCDVVPSKRDLWSFFTDCFETARSRTCTRTHVSARAIMGAYYLFLSLSLHVFFVTFRWLPRCVIYLHPHPHHVCTCARISTSCMQHCAWKGLDRATAGTLRLLFFNPILHSCSCSFEPIFFESEKFYHHVISSFSFNLVVWL